MSERSKDRMTISFIDALSRYTAEALLRLDSLSQTTFEQKICREEKPFTDIQKHRGGAQGASGGACSC